MSSSAIRLSSSNPPENNDQGSLPSSSSSAQHDDTIRTILQKVQVSSRNDDASENSGSLSSSLPLEWIEGATKALQQTLFKEINDKKEEESAAQDEQQSAVDHGSRNPTTSTTGSTTEQDAFLQTLNEWTTAMMRLSQQSLMDHSTGTRQRKKGQVRQALQYHARQLCLYDHANDDQTSSTPPIRSAAMGGVLLALALQAPLHPDAREACRAVASAFGGALQQRQSKHPIRGNNHQNNSSTPPQNDSSSPTPLDSNDDTTRIGASILQELLLCEQPLDLHIVSLLGEAFQWPVDPQVACHAIEMEQKHQTMREEQQQQQSTTASMDSVSFRKQSLAAILRFATYSQPWAYLPAASLIQPAAEWDLWHAAVKVCQSVISHTQQEQEVIQGEISQSVTPSHKDNPKSSPVAQSTDNNSHRGTDCVSALIRCAVEGKRYRQADDYATQFYDYLSHPTLLVQARLLHAYSTIIKLISKRQYQIIERQVLGVDQAVDRVLQDASDSDSANQLVIHGIGDDDEGDTMELHQIKDEIRTFVLDHLVMANQVEAAQRLAQLWNRNIQYSPEALAKAAEERKRTYLQWEDVLADHPVPELIDTPQTLLQAFETIRAQSHLTTEKVEEGEVWGLDCEWDGEGGSGVALLQLATVQGGAVLIDVPVLNDSPEGRQALQTTVGDLLSSRQDTVVGFHCQQDLSRLRQSCTVLTTPGQEEPWISDTSAVVDLKQILMSNAAPGEAMGLSKVCEQFMGKKLDKSEQCSAWSTRPLSVEQRIYGALDAYICAAVFEKVSFSRQSD